MSDKTGGPAFPLNLIHQYGWEPNIPLPGLTLRDYFAAAALQGFISNPNVDWGFDDAAKAAYAQADAMIEARDK